jgi:hypothetical protein
METDTSEGKLKLSPEEEQARTARAYARKRRHEGVSGGAAAVVDAYESVIGKSSLKRKASRHAGSEDYITSNGSTEKARHEAIMKEIRKFQRQYLHGPQHP